MKKFVIGVLLLVTGVAVGQYGGDKLWVHSEYQDTQIHMYFAEDKETGTRCYVVNGQYQGSVGASYPVAISCVPKH